MPPDPAARSEHRDSGLKTVDNLSSEFERRWLAGERPSIESMLVEIAEAHRAEALVRLVALEMTFRRQSGEQPTLDEYLARFPQDEEMIKSALLKTDLPEQSFQSTVTFRASQGITTIPEFSVIQPGIPTGLGRYQIRGLLGTGAFGQVWRAYDPGLDRDVAIKIPRPDRAHPVGSLDRFLAEASKAARLNCDGVVRIHDVGTDAGQFYIVSELLDGGTLADRLGRGSPGNSWPSFRESAELIADVAKAIHQAHVADLTHRDLKPSNILLDRQGRPKIADFGLAVAEVEQLEEASSSIGTPAYMSPEQARGDSNRVDARTDIYSLGVIFYQLLCRRLPYIAKSREEYFDQILHREPRPPRTIDDQIPKELERICLRCLSKSMGERYTTAADLADDLRRWATRDLALEIPSQPVRGRWIRVAVGLFLLAVFGTVLAMIAHNWSSRGSQTIHERNLTPALEQAWISQFGKSPGLIDWPGGKRAPRSARFNGDVNAYEVTASEIALVELGTLGEGRYRFGIDIEQVPWLGGVGVFFDYRTMRQGGSDHAMLQRLTLEHATLADGGERFRIHRIPGAISAASATFSGSGFEATPAEVKMPFNGQSVRLEIEVEHGRLKRVSWNAVDLPALVAEEFEMETGFLSCAGRFGLYCDVGTTWFSNPKLEILEGDQQ